MAIGVSALGPLVFTPFANVYGRRPAYLISVLIGLVTAVGSATATSYGRLLVARIFNGFGPSAAQGLGAGTVVDIFYGHQRGRAMGIFTLMSTNGAHLAPIVRFEFLLQMFSDYFTYTDRWICRQRWRLAMVFLGWRDPQCDHIFSCLLLHARDLIRQAR